MVHCGGSPVRDVGMASDRNGVKSPLSVFFFFLNGVQMLEEQHHNGWWKDDQTVSKEDQIMLEFIHPINVLKNDIKNYGQ